MLVVVTTVSSLVHLYSWGYMAEDDSQSRFFAYLSLFTFAMLMLVTADNLVQMFFGWEGVGLASYLRSEEHTSELQSLMRISYVVFCLKKTNTIHSTLNTRYYLNYI